jgi:hypothetical protein
MGSMNTRDNTPKRPRQYSPAELEAELRKRLETFEEDAKAARPAEVVIRELRERYAPK